MVQRLVGDFLDRRRLDPAAGNVAENVGAAPAVEYRRAGFGDLVLLDAVTGKEMRIVAVAAQLLDECRALRRVAADGDGRGALAGEALRAGAADAGGAAGDDGDLAADRGQVIEGTGHGIVLTRSSCRH